MTSPCLPSLAKEVAGVGNTVKLREGPKAADYQTGAETRSAAGANHPGYGKNVRRCTNGLSAAKSYQASSFLRRPQRMQFTD